MVDLPHKSELLSVCFYEVVIRHIQKDFKNIFVFLFFSL